jgi:hypothetical protein
MITKYMFVDADGDEFRDYAPFQDIPVEVVSACYWPGGHDGEDEMVITLRYLGREHRGDHICRDKSCYGFRDNRMD